MTKGVTGNGTSKIILDLAHLNCASDPIIIDLFGTQFILKYNGLVKEGEFGKMYLEKCAD